MTGHHDTKPGEKTRQSDKRLEEHESVLDSPEHIEGVEKTATRQSHQKKKSAEECESVLSGSECIEPEKQTKPSGGKVDRSPRGDSCGELQRPALRFGYSGGRTLTLS